MSERHPNIDWPNIPAIVVRGHQVASGNSGDKRFPDGTLKLQEPFFQEAGLDLTGWHLATMNLSLRPATYEIINPRLTFRQVQADNSRWVDVVWPSWTTCLLSLR